MSLTKAEVQRFRGDFEKAVAQLGKEYGVNITLGTIRYDSGGLRATMKAQVGAAPAKAEKGDFQVGDVVFIMHKKVDPIRNLKLLKLIIKTLRLETEIIIK